MKIMPSDILTLLGLLFIGTQLASAQNPKSFFYENEFGLSFPVETRWSMDVGIGYRALLQEKSGGEILAEYENEHLEIDHFTNYDAGTNLELSLGLRYRFKELFEESSTDEFRIIEQVKLKSIILYLPLSHRFRLEQRFREQVSHRLRYKLKYGQSIGNNFSLAVGTEALYAVSPQMNPEAEQRFSMGLENASFDQLELELSFDYRLENYTHDLAHEFFVKTGITLSL